MAYEFVDDIATADCAVRVTAETAEQLFQDAAAALVDIMTVASSINPLRTWDVELENDTLERLLYSWLSELVYIKDSENVLFSGTSVRIVRNENSFSLKAELKGEPIDHDRHDIGVDVKAVTMHMFKIEETDDGWEAFVIFDL